MPDTETLQLDAAATRAAAITQGNLRRTMLALAFPVLAEQLLNSCVGMFDVFLAGRISTIATNAIGISAYTSWFATLLFSLVAVGTTALVARCVGARDFTGADRVCNQSISLAVATGVVVSCLLYFLAPHFAAWQNMTGEAGRIATDYLRYDALGYTAMSVTLATGAALRGAGDMRAPMFVYAVINVLNMIASPALVFGWGPCPQLGVNGIVAGTVIARTAGGVICFALLWRGRAGLRLHFAGMRFERDTVRRLLRIGLPAAVDGVLLWGGQFLFLKVIAHLKPGAVGDAMYASHIIAVRVESLSYLPALAWATATATMVGQALGARDSVRARRVGHEGAMQAALLIFAVAVFFYFGSDFIFRVMHKDPLVREVGAKPFRLWAFFQPCLAFSIVYIGALRGAGNTRLPMLITAVGMIVFRLPLGYLFGIRLGGGLIGAWVGMFADMTWRAVAATALYLSGRWTKTRV
ncbi:MAG: putative FMN/FAD exporter YeeO [Phycisphaerae bacterium]|nr:putative FMN/FAD exporter YeeO [Phycisphaerae bacterium]